MNFIFATKNKHKMDEILSLMNECGHYAVSMEEAGINIEIEEDGITFEDNALLKARTIMGVSGMPTLSDDSGIEIDYLGKKPGVHSARYMGVDTPYYEKNKKILELLAGVSEDKRTARFVCVIAAVFPDGREICVTATAEGYIGYEIKGNNGFGYDPIFVPEGMDMTMAELTMDEKNRISHRAKALHLMKNKLKAL